MQDIPQGKELIGVYGNRSQDRCYIKSLGFILWTPNPYCSKEEDAGRFIMNEPESLRLFWHIYLTLMPVNLLTF